MHWNFSDVRIGQAVGTIELPYIRMGIILIVDITRTEKGMSLCINGEDIDVPFGKVIETQDYKIRCYRELTRLTLFVS